LIVSELCGQGGDANKQYGEELGAPPHFICVT
jgi:hypothetical protein